MTGIWRGALHIVRYELRTSWGGMLLSLLFFSYIALMSTPLLEGLVSGEYGSESAWMIDLLYFCITPLLGFLFTRSSMRYWRDDPYTKKLALWQTMPIRIEQIVAGRLMLLIIVAVPMVIFFFGSQYVLSAGIRELLSPIAYLNYMLIWLGYSITCAVTYIYFELGFTGKMYLILCFAYIPVFVLLTLAGWLNGKSAIMFTLEQAQAGEWTVALLTLIAAVGAVSAGSQLIGRRIRTRSLWN